MFPWRELDISRVMADGFSKEKLRFEIDQDSILKLLTGHTLYNDSTVVLRELIQNSIDAGRYYDANSKKKSDYQCEIKVHWDSDKRILTLSDNATGMDLNSIKNYLLRVGASKYRSEEAMKLVPGFHSISRFGIGLLTCFMIAHDVDIYTLDEVEDKCYLLKIRKLTGEYLMRNDADRSKISGGKHGTTFELAVDKSVDMTDIEQQIRQWIFVPFGSVTLTIDSKPPVNIGYQNVEEAITQFASIRMGVNIDDKKYRIWKGERDGIHMACLQKYNEWNKSWSLCHYEERNLVKDAPIGICIEGIRVVNKVYDMYLSMIVEQMEEMKSNHSMLWIADSIANLIDAISPSYSFRNYFANRDIFLQRLRKQKCCVMDNGDNLSFVSIDELGDEVWGLDSQSYDTAVTLLHSMDTDKTTALKLIRELRDKDFGIDSPVILNHRMSNCVAEMFANEFDVKKIVIDWEHRTLKFLFSHKNSRWQRVDCGRHHMGRKKLYIPLTDAPNLEIVNLNDEFAIVSRDGVFINPKAEIVPLLNKTISDRNLRAKFLDVVGNYVMLVAHDRTYLNQLKFENYFSSDENLLKDGLWQIVSKEELKSALPKSDCKVCNFYGRPSLREW